MSDLAAAGSAVRNIDNGRREKENAVTDDGSICERTESADDSVGAWKKGMKSVTDIASKQTRNLKSLVRLPANGVGCSHTDTSDRQVPETRAMDISNGNGHPNGHSPAKAISFKIKEEIYIVLNDEPSGKKTIHSQTELPSTTTSTVAKSSKISKSAIGSTCCHKLPNGVRPTANRPDFGQRELREIDNTSGSTTGTKVPSSESLPNALSSRKSNPLKPFQTFISETTASLGMIPRHSICNGARRLGSLSASTATKLPATLPSDIDCAGPITDPIVSMRDGKHCLVKVSLALQADKRFYVESNEENPKYKDLMVTVVTASRHHPLFGSFQREISANVTYDAKGHMVVIETPFIRSGLFKVESTKNSWPHPHFPDCIVNETRFISCSTLDICTMPMLSQYVILGDILQIPTAIRKSKDPMTNKLMEFLYSPQFEKFTLPILLGHGEPNVWSKIVGAPRVKPVFLAEKVNHERWKWVEKVPEKKSIISNYDPRNSVEIECIPDNVPLCHYIYGNCVSDAVHPEVREILMQKHRAQCNGCLDCLTPEDRKINCDIGPEKKNDMGESGSQMRDRRRQRRNFKTKSEAVVKREDAKSGGEGTIKPASSATSGANCRTRKMTSMAPVVLKVEKVPELAAEMSTTCSELENTRKYFAASTVQLLRQEKAAESLESNSCIEILNTPSRVEKAPKFKRQTESVGPEGRNVKPCDTEASSASASREAGTRGTAEVDFRASKELIHVHVERKTKSNFTRPKACRVGRTTNGVSESGPHADRHEVGSVGCIASDPEKESESETDADKQNASYETSTDTDRVSSPTSSDSCIIVTEINTCNRQEVREVAAALLKSKRSRKNKATYDCPDCISLTTTDNSTKRQRSSDKMI